MALSTLLTSDALSVVGGKLRERDEERKLSIDLSLTEPAVFLPRGTSNNPVVLRGCCVLHVKRPLKIKCLTVTLEGFSFVRWPVGLREVGSVVDRSLKLFNSSDPNSRSKGRFTPFDGDAQEPEKVIASATETKIRQRKSNMLRRAVNKLRSRPPSDPDASSSWFLPGTYSFDFEMVLQPKLPESIAINCTRVWYNLKARVERHGILHRKFRTKHEVTAIRCPVEDFIDDSQPFSLVRSYGGLMHFEIMVPSQGAPLDHRLPLEFRYTETEGIHFQKLRIFVVEDTRYRMKDGSPACKGPYKRFLLHETVNQTTDSEEVEEYYPDSLPHPNLTLTSSPSSTTPSSSSKHEERPSTGGGAPVEIDLQLPACMAHCGNEGKYMHHDADYKNVQVSHFLEFVIHLLVDTDPGPGRTKSFTVHTRLALRSCFAHPDNASLPAYARNDGLPGYSLALI
ncbi:uncharacterized protein ACLA_013830 [Aspergillus clavatus NRRL 1]|uniref:Arrestin-like N-terminal domain-containing protein n=1 Tax=Aspergillus clavatus (strain ATCC 1007 / CBS 513.65 / DSM 816 / NCTC 3887 / NRRL 1 / QM 1276 / 107) TaxID=344612 RepID=A1CB28_ASPCL|nr:uncharacterized protein ACLA_013830 [Aspergillus clavatus NRRL 1]EAW12946.1 conserved hypothetical protein [Aspergillus clavatus NRRL 1]